MASYPFCSIRARHSANTFRATGRQAARGSPPAQPVAPCALSARHHRPCRCSRGSQPGVSRVSLSPGQTSRSRTSPGTWGRCRRRRRW
jgi:hypothetical protein